MTDPVADVFERAASVYDSVIPFFETFGRRLVERAHLVPGEHVLDVATGRGAVLLPAAAAVAPTGHVLGIDLAPTMVRETARDLERRGITNAEVQVMDAMALAVPDGSFDAVTCAFSLQLLPDPVAAAAGFRRVLRDGGRVVASAPTGAGDEWSFVGELVMAAIPKLRAMPSSPPNPNFDLAATLTAAGFTAVDVVEVSERFVFRDATEWFEWTMTQGQRWVVDALDADDAKEFREASVARAANLMTPEGIVLHQRAAIAVAES